LRYSSLLPTSHRQKKQIRVSRGLAITDLLFDGNLSTVVEIVCVCTIAEITVLESDIP